MILKYKYSKTNSNLANQLNKKPFLLTNICLKYLKAFRSKIIIWELICGWDIEESEGED